jgi:hypothetical protein
MRIRFDVSDRDARRVLRATGIPITLQALEVIRRHLNAECTVLAESILFGDAADWWSVYEERLPDVQSILPKRRPVPSQEIAPPPEKPAGPVRRSTTTEGGLRRGPGRPRLRERPDLRVTVRRRYHRDQDLITLLEATLNKNELIRRALRALLERQIM